MQPNSEIFHHIQRFLESAHNYCTIPILNSPYKYSFYVWTQSTVIRTFHIRKHTLDNLWDSDILIQSNSSDLCLLALKFWLNPLPAWAMQLYWFIPFRAQIMHSSRKQASKFWRKLSVKPSDKIWSLETWKALYLHPGFQYIGVQTFHFPMPHGENN